MGFFIEIVNMYLRGYALEQIAITFLLPILSERVPRYIIAGISLIGVTVSANELNN